MHVIFSSFVHIPVFNFPVFYLRSLAFFVSAGGRRNFSRLILGAPVWRVDQHEAVLTGAAQCLARNLEHSLRSAA